MSTVIDVRLVGFQKGSGGDLVMDASQLTEVLNQAATSASQPGSRVHTVLPHTFASVFQRHHHSNTLDVEEKVLFRVSDVKDLSLLNGLESMLRSRVYTNEESSLPVSSTNSLIRRHFKQQPSYGAYVMYIVNPKVAPVRALDANGVPEGWRQPIYWYVDDRGHLSSKDSGSSRNPVARRCGVSSWVDSVDRFVWIDVAAGPCEHGPRSEGDGDVTEYTIPNGANRWRGRVRGRGRGRGREGGEGGDLAGQLASQVWVARQHLFLPTLFHARHGWREKSSRKVAGEKSSRSVDSVDKTAYQESRHDVRVVVKHLLESRVTQWLGWSVVGEAVRSIALPSQHVQFHHETLLIHDYPLCVSGLIQTLTFGDSGGGMESSDRWMQSMRSCFASVIQSNTKSNVYPVFVIDAPSVVRAVLKMEEARRSTIVSSLSSSSGEPVSISVDGVFVAVTWSDIAVVLRISDVQKATPRFMCNGLPMKNDNHYDVRRVTFATVLSGVWGVLPTQHRWQEESKSMVVDWRWSVSNTPYGPFVVDHPKNSIPFSFVQRDAAHRNQIYVRVHQILFELKESLGMNLSARRKGVQSGGSSNGGSSGGSGGIQLRVRMTLEETHALEILWSVAKDCLKRVGSYASILEFQHALEQVNEFEEVTKELLEKMTNISKKFEVVESCAV